MCKTTADDFEVQLGMFTDTYICKHCGLQWDLLMSPHWVHHVFCNEKHDD